MMLGAAEPPLRKFAGPLAPRIYGALAPSRLAAGPKLYTEV